MKPSNKVQNRLPKALLSAFAVGAMSTHASTVSFVGVDADRGTEWRNTDVVKLFDADANNVYGTAGYFLIATGGGNGVSPTIGTDIIQDPSFIAAGSQGVLAGINRAAFNSYDVLNDPAFPHPPTAPTLLSGTVTDGTGDKFSFTIAAGGAPTSFRLSIFADNLDGVGFNAASLTVRNAANTATATAPAIIGNQDTDLFVFQIDGAVAGEQFFVAAAQGVNGTATFAGLAYDAVPEPTSMVLGLIGGLGMLGMLRRRNR